MVDAPSKPRRRWFQFGLSECLILGPLLAVLWWRCVVMPVYISVAFDTKRSPTALEAALRGVPASLAIVGLWLLARAGSSEERKPATILTWALRVLSIFCFVFSALLALAAFTNVDPTANPLVRRENAIGAIYALTTGVALLLAARWSTAHRSATQP
jgi:hypothetical protein